MDKDLWSCVCGFQGTKKELDKHNRITGHEIVCF
jgi:hypothetical protein